MCRIRSLFSVIYLQIIVFIALSLLYTAEIVGSVFLFNFILLLNSFGIIPLLVWDS